MKTIRKFFDRSNLDTVGVTGSIPVVRTIFNTKYTKLQLTLQAIREPATWSNTQLYAHIRKHHCGEIAVAV